MQNRITRSVFLAATAALWVGVMGTVVPVAFAQSGTQSQKSKRAVRGILGQLAPELAVNKWQQLPAGQTEVKLDDYRGKVVYLYFFQSWCPGCHSSGFPKMVELQKQFEGNDEVAFLTVQTTFEGKSTNTPENALATAQKFELEIPVGHSQAKRGGPQIMKDYRTGGTPWVIVIDKEGVVRFNDYHVDVDEAAELIKDLQKN
jgi:thiol-disulfide isomerase/thioredoxin